MMERDMMELPEYRACVALPMLDRPRLELAMALDNRWPDRADYIRFEIWAHRVRHFRPPRSPSYLNSLGRGLELDRRLKGRWDPPFEVKVESHSRERGLVESITLSAAGFLANETLVMDRFPILWMKITGCTVDDLRRLATRASLSRLIGLYVEAPGVGDAGLRIFLESAHLRSLKVFGFRNAGLTMTGYEMVAEATKTTLAALEYGSLTGNLIEAPDEREPSYDGGAPVLETVGSLPPQGRCLDENMGYQKWLHPYSRFGADFNTRMFERPLDMDETPIPDEVALGEPPQFSRY